MSKVTRVPINQYVKLPGGVLEHNEVYGKAFGGVFPQDGVHVHHINCLKYDNRPENLIAVPVKFHRWLHGLTGRKTDQLKMVFYSEVAKHNLIDRDDIIYLLNQHEDKQFTLSSSFFGIFVKHILVNRIKDKP